MATPLLRCMSPERFEAAERGYPLDGREWE